MIRGLTPTARQKAGLFGLFCCAGLAFGAHAAAEPLAIDVAAARPGYDPRNNLHVVVVTMSDASKQAFAELARTNIDRRLDVRIDGKTVTAPVIKQPILSGSIQVIGPFTAQQVRELATRLGDGKSKLEVEIVE